MSTDSRPFYHLIVLLIAVTLSVPLTLGGPRVPSAAAATAMIDLGTLGGAFSVAYDINDAGQVVGASQNTAGAQCPVRWQNGVPSTLGTCSSLPSSSDLNQAPAHNTLAHGINEAGQVVGWIQTAPGELQAFRWQGGGTTNLGTLGGVSSQAYGISEAGQVVGQSQTETGAWHAFLWTSGGTDGVPSNPQMQDLGTLTGYPSGSYASGINMHGQVVGASWNEATGKWRAFLWHDGVMTDLGILQEGHTSSSASQINDLGQVVGTSRNDATAEERPFLWTPQTPNGTMTDLGTLGAGGGASDINESGQVVGASATPTGAVHAFRWDDGVMTDLGTLGGSTSYGYGINEAGQVVGWSQTASGDWHAFLARGTSGVQAGATITVTTTADELNTDGDCALREAVRAANLNTAVDACPAGRGADTILLPAGTYILTRVGGDEAAKLGDLDLTKDVTISGAGASTTIIDGNQLDRVFDIPAGVRVTLKQLTVRNGRVASSLVGGGIANRGTLLVANSVVTANAAVQSGGGIYNLGGMTIQASIISSNTVSDASGEGVGGGIYNGGELTVRDSTITANSTAAYGRGGGIFNISALRLVDSVIAENSSLGQGGGVTNFGGTLLIQRSTISGNQAPVAGGIENISSSLTVTDSTISGNTASTGSAGGILNYSHLGLANSPVTIINSTISGNIAAEGGAGIMNQGQTVTLRNSTISGNAAGRTGGGIYNTGTNANLPGIVHLYNVTIVANIANSANEVGQGGGGVFNSTFASGDRIHLYNSILAGNTEGLGETPECQGTLSSQGYNLIGDVTECTVEGDQTGNLVGVDPLLGPLQDNGGPRQTHALLAGSPAIDAGNPATPGSGGSACLAKDQRGVVRPQDGNGDGTARCDIGAFERNVSATGQDVGPSEAETEAFDDEVAPDGSEPLTEPAASDEMDAERVVPPDADSQDGP